MFRGFMIVLMMQGFALFADVQIFEDPDYRIYVFQDASNRFPATLFSSADPEEKFVQSAKDYPGSVNVFVVEFKADKKRVMIDSGFGTPKGNLLAEMEKAKIAPETISHILITHLHFDHIGGLRQFPKAKVHVPKEEYEMWNGILMTKKENIVLFEYDKEVVPQIRALRYSGHTPGHTIFRLKNCYFVGDIVHAADLQIEHPSFCARYDWQKNEAVASRKKALKELKGELFGAHIPFPGKFVNKPKQSH